MKTRFSANTLFDDPGVYRIVNTESEKVYIGGSQVSIKNRFRDHRSNLERGDHSNPYLQNSYDKHGADIFVFEVLKNVNPDDVWEQEQWWLDYYKDSDTECFNIKEDIEEPLGAQVEWTDERREKRAELSRKLWENNREKMERAAKVNRVKHKGRVLRGPDGELYEIEEHTRKFAEDKENLTKEYVCGILNGDKRSLHGWTDGENLYKPATYRNVYSFFEIENIKTGEVKSARSQRGLRDKVNISRPTIGLLSRNPHKTTKDGWTITDRVHPNKTYQQIKKEHEQLTSN